MFREARGWTVFAARLEWVGVGASKAKCHVEETVTSIHQKKRKQMGDECSEWTKASHQCPVSGLQVNHCQEQQGGQNHGTPGSSALLRLQST